MVGCLALPSAIFDVFLFLRHPSSIPLKNVLCKICFLYLGRHLIKINLGILVASGLSLLEFIMEDNEALLTVERICSSEGDKKYLFKVVF